jgi:hypothetical protein
MARVFTIDPYGSEVVEWVDRMTLELEPFGDITELVCYDEWKDWARAVIQNPAIARCQPPDPTVFDDWREWAARFNQTIYALSN